MKIDQARYGIVKPLDIVTATEGVLSGVTFVAKDLFDIAGYPTGAGNPDWLRTHGPASSTAEAVSQLLSAGAHLVGKSLTDELAFSLDGINFHYGTPLNPQFEDRIPGGSSSGSTSAAAAGLVQFGLGTDTVGSARVPAAYCGIYGIRTTHGAISLSGAVPLGRSFDTVGWCARDAEMMKRVGQVLLPFQKRTVLPRTASFIEDAFDLIENSALRENLLEKATGLFRKAGFDIERLRLIENYLDRSMNVFNTMRSYEAYLAHGAWLRDVNPCFGPGIRERFEACGQVTENQYLEACEQRQPLKDYIGKLTAGAVLVMPTICAWPPMLNSPADLLQNNRLTNVRLSVLSSIGGIPQITVPVALNSSEVSGRIGISLATARDSDLDLLDLAASLPGAR